MNHAIVEVSVLSSAVITKLVLAVLAVTAKAEATATVPNAWQVRKISEFAVTAVVATVAVPATKATEPNELAPAAVVVPTLVDEILLPAVPRTRLPLVAVMLPKVAVTVVVAAIEPGAVNTAGIVKVIVLTALVAVI
jgi:hypothetical protein